MIFLLLRRAFVLMNHGDFFKKMKFWVVWASTIKFSYFWRWTRDIQERLHIIAISMIKHNRFLLSSDFFSKFWCSGRIFGVTIDLKNNVKFSNLLPYFKKTLRTVRNSINFDGKWEFSEFLDQNWTSICTLQRTTYSNIDKLEFECCRILSALQILRITMLKM